LHPARRWSPPWSSALRCFAADYFLFYLDADFVDIAYYLFLDLAFDYILDYLTFDLVRTTSCTT
jgi:hypothetical protein